MQFIYDGIIILFIIIFTTFIQKYYFMILFQMKSFNIFLSGFFGVIIRFWVIIHEFCHIFFWFFSGNKLREVSLFDKNGWKVVYETKNYIGHLHEYGFSLNYFFLLILNQIWIFLTAFWPLIIWITFTFFLFQSLWIHDLNTLKNIDIDYKIIAILFIYSVFIPSFVLSYEDLAKFFISSQDNIFSTFFWSIINTIIFAWFLLLFSHFFVPYFIFFGVIFLSMFCVQLFLYLFIFILKKL